MDTLSATYHEGRYAHFTRSEDSNQLQRCAEHNQADCSLRALTWDRAFEAFAVVLALVQNYTVDDLYSRSSGESLRKINAAQGRW